MSYSIQCVHCKAVLKAPAPVPGGKNVKCPKCKQVFTTPFPETDKTAEVPNDFEVPPPPEKPAPVNVDSLGDDDMEAAIAKLQTEQASGKKPAPAPPPAAPKPAPKPTQLSPGIDEDDEMAAAVAKLEAEQAAKKPAPPPPAPPKPIPNMEIHDALDGEILPDDDDVDEDPTQVIDVEEVLDEVERSAKKKRRAEEEEDEADEEDEPRSKKKRRDDDEEEDEPRAKKKRRDDDEVEEKAEDEEEQRAKKKRKDEDDEEDEPRAKKKRRDDDEDDAPRPKKKSKKKSGAMMWILLGGGVFALLGCCVCGVGGYFMFGDSVFAPSVVGRWEREDLGVKTIIDFRADKRYTMETRVGQNMVKIDSQYLQEGNRVTLMGGRLRVVFIARRSGNTLFLRDENTGVEQAFTKAG